MDAKWGGEKQVLKPYFFFKLPSIVKFIVIVIYGTHTHTSRCCVMERIEMANAESEVIE